jgi:hypothetical protein
MVKPRAVAVLAVMVLVAGLALSANPGWAAAAASADEPAVKVARFGREALARATQPAGQRARADRRAETRIGRYLAEQARSGRLVDRAALRMAVIPSPFAKGEIGVIWDDASVLEKLDVFEQENAEQGQAGIGAVFGESPAGAARKDAVAAGGFGYGAGFNPRNMYKYSSGCRTVFFGSAYPSNEDHWTTTCYQKWAEPGTRNWIYNRWAVWDKAQPKYSWDWNWTADFTIRSRPWRGYESRVSGIQNWTPAYGSGSCSEIANVTLSIGAASLSIPLHRCQSQQVLPNATARSMGIDWDGLSTAQLYLDFGLELVAANTTTVPIYADYVWATMKYCQAPCAAPSWQNLKWTDSGW